MHAMIPVFDRVPATKQTSQAIPAHYARAGSAIVAYDKAQSGTVKLQASHDGEAWVDVPGASASVAAPGQYILAWETVSPWLRLVSATEGPEPENEIQGWEVESDTIAGGTFTLSDGHNTSAPVDWNSMDGPGLFIAALEEVYGAGNISWALHDGIGWEYVGTLAGQTLPLTIIDISQLVPSGEEPISDKVRRLQKGHPGGPGSITASVFLSGSRS